MKKLFAVSALAFFAVFGGCKEKSPEKRGQAALEQVKVPDAPDRVVTEAAKALKEGNLIALYAMLPESYQKDLQGLVTKAVSKVDAQVYSKTWTIVDKTLAAVKKSEQKLAQGISLPAIQVVAAQEEFIGLLKEAKLNDIEELKTLNIAAFLSEHGKKLSDLIWKIGETFAKKQIAEAKKMLDVTAEAKDVKENEAVVVITQGERKLEVPFVKVEGKWLPKGLTKMWKRRIERANKRLDEALEQYDRGKEQARALLRSLDEALTRLDANGTPQEFFLAFRLLTGGGFGINPRLTEIPATGAAKAAPEVAPAK